jgi:hypothetical protein
MHTLLTPAFDVDYEDIKGFELKDDLLYIYLKGLPQPRIFPNGAVRKKQLDQLRDIHHLHTFLQKNAITHTAAANAIGMCHATISNLFRNNTMSKGVKELLAKQYPGVFDTKKREDENE